MSEEPTLIRAKAGWLWIPVGILSVLSGWVYWGGWNEKVFLWINGLSGYTGENYWALLTILSDGLVSGVILLPWIRRKPEIIWAAFLAAMGFVLLSETMKHMGNVPRPPRVLPAEQITVIGPSYRQHSFPSGHAAMILALAGVWAFHVRERWLRVVLFFFGSLVAVSRVVVGVHWPLDVLVGGILGWGMAWPGLWLARRWAWGYSRPFVRLYGAILLAGCVVLWFPYTKVHQILWEQRTLAVVFFIIGLHEYVKGWRGEETGRVRSNERDVPHG